ncbi:Lpp/OprI family alanine-zipper lipoprotein [Thaumasiovibrio sp. DFM-14]|uniref:Lpp/OprI family alanine-zipper lipoprotein n=1 Tax=Thaumasiovibrio sp. DFM-14 TaxID=3384792 RepID=UPI0039A18F70
MKKTLSLLTVAALTTFVVGCSSSDNVQADSIDNLSNQVAALADKVQSLEMKQDETLAAAQSADASAQAAMKEAMRANQRIDNMATQYSK